MDAKESLNGVAGQGSAADQDTIPPHIRDRFRKEGRRFFLPDGSLAFRDHGHKLTTLSENTEIVRSLIEIAKARGWQEIEVTGTDAFRRAALQHAASLRMTVRGQPRAPTEESPSAAREGPTQSTPPARPPPSQSRDRRLTGVLVGHGREHYRFDPHEPVSYYVKLKTELGREITLWGLDLERAINHSQSQPHVGERIVVRQTGREPVTIPGKERDSASSSPPGQPLKTFRNTWLVETEAFFEARARAAEILRDTKVTAQRGTGTHPQLVGTYLAMGAAEKIAAQRFPDPEDRQRFVAMTREALARSVEAGERLVSPKLRARVRSGREAEQVQAR